ncbi:hypothetical protein WJ96_05275 [Burkholderia ubonensis]|uniref:Uncharacterized protein n=1 Tax=Burkholderia ubonensis TaxID=101571 RepID=A0AAW3MVK8_9BURK|nr:hypothetical protein [Burkholderia ubonensis]KVP97983.1 hypothetical protein WJ96_05275 [Burkholderia ubonensis]KVZ92680.1 hypothetical protein WL25_16930 [Burkholderia ubonensis]
MGAESIKRTGKAGHSLTRLDDIAEGVLTSELSIEIAAENLREALWEPQIIPDPESPEPWGAWCWHFALDDGTKGMLTNDRRGGKRWSVWLVDDEHQTAVEDALVDVIRSAGFRAKVLYT